MNNLATSSAPGSNPMAQGIGLQVSSGLERIGSGSATGLTGMHGLTSGASALGASFERLASASGISGAYTPGIIKELVGGGDNFSRLSSLVSTPTARLSAPVGAAPSGADVFAGTASSYLSLTNPDFQRVSSLVGGLSQSHDHLNGLDAHAGKANAPSAPLSGIHGGMVGYGGHSAPFTRAPSMGQTPMHTLPFGLFHGHSSGVGVMGAQGKGTTDGMGHTNAHVANAHVGMLQTPAGRVPMEAWPRTMAGPHVGHDMFGRTNSTSFPTMVGTEASAPASGIMGHWDPSTLGGAGGAMAMDVWGMHNPQLGAAHHAGLLGFGFPQEHMAMMNPAVYATHGLQMHPVMTAMRQMPEGAQDGEGKGKKGRGKKKAGKTQRSNDPEAAARKKRRSDKRAAKEGGGCGGDGEEEGQGFEKHNQFLWAKRMGQQNEPRWGLFKQGGSAGPAFLKLLEELESDGVIERTFGEVPEALGGVSGWVVKEGMMSEWQRRRQAWFMEGKEGKDYKPNSLYQIMRRLGYFPTMRSSRAGHGHDFDGSTTFRWDSDRKYSQRRTSKLSGSDGGGDDMGNAKGSSAPPMPPVPPHGMGMGAIKNALSAGGGMMMQHNGLVNGMAPAMAGVNGGMNRFVGGLRKLP